MKPRPPRFPGRSTRQVARMFAATPGLNLLLLPRSARSAKVPGNRAVGPYLAARVRVDEKQEPLACWRRGYRGIPPTTTPGTARSADAGVASFPHALYRKAGTLAPTRQARSSTSKNARGNAGSARGGVLPGVPNGGQPPVGPDPADAGGLPYPRNRFTSPGIKATPLTLLLDRIVRDDESGAEAALRIFRQFRQRGCMVVSVRESWLNGSPEVQDILIAFAGGAERGSARRSERIKAGLARRRCRGGGRPSGRRDGQASARGRATSGRGKKAARGAWRQGTGECAMTRQVSSPCPTCGHGLRARPVPGGYVRECPSCGWSQVARREDERFHPCPACCHWGPRGAAGVLPFTVRHGRAWVLLSRRSPHVQHGGTGHAPAARRTRARRRGRLPSARRARRSAGST